MRRIFFIDLTIVLLTVSHIHIAYAQTNDFNSFRNQMLKGYGEFRKSVLDGYAEYLNTVWKEYTAFRGEQRDRIPKPMMPKSVDDTPAAVPQEQKPVVKKPATEPNPQPAAPRKDAPPLPPPAPVTAPASVPDVNFSFYGQTLKVPKLQCAPVRAFTPAEVSEAWQEYEAAKAQEIARKYLQIARTLGLNDWFTYEMVKESVNQQCKNNSMVERAALLHFLLANMGYDVRFARCDDKPTFLIPIKEQVYSRSFLRMNDRKYYLYPLEGNGAVEGQSLYTYDLPEDVELGESMDMLITNGMRVGTGQKRSKTFEWKDMKVTAEVDAGTMEMLRRYPQVDIPYYAMSDITPQVRKSVLEQLRPHLKGLTPAGAANKLLHFVQFAFSYATDDEQHGYEKPYFFEENFYYPKNDCEDRAIFYAYLVRNLLGLDVHLIHYPGHECTAVCFGQENVKGTGYVYQGKRFVICDPTYIGASIGQCMPDYVKEEPKIELW